jgi:hypothetical protein
MVHCKKGLRFSRLQPDVTNQSLPLGTHPLRRIKEPGTAYDESQVLPTMQDKGARYFRLCRIREPGTAHDRDRYLPLCRIRKPDTAYTVKKSLPFSRPQPGCH